MVASQTLFQVGDTVRITGTFKNAADVPTNPTTVTLVITHPDRTQTTYTAGASPELPAGTAGVYVALIPVTMAGRHFWRMVGTGAVASAEQGSFYVEPIPS